MFKFTTKQKIFFAISLFLLAFFIAWTILVSFVDVNQVGLSHLNLFFWRLCGENVTWKWITDVLGYTLLGVIVGIVLWQIWQWVQRKSLLRVDKNLLLVDVICVCLLVIYLFFEIVVINYGPSTIDGVNKASYPSSHTMLFVAILPILIWHVWHYLSSQPWRVFLTVLLVAWLLVGVVGRMLCGAHWFTDIAAGIVMGCILNCLYFAFVDNVR